MFTIVGEALSYVINQAKVHNLVKGFKVGKDNIELSHLQLAYATLLFVPQDTEVLLNYKKLLGCFGLMTGLQVNFDKSSLVCWQRNTEWVDQLADSLGCKVENYP